MNPCPTVCLAGMTQAEIGSIELSSMTQISFFGILDFFIVICLLFGYCYLVLIRHPDKLNQ